MADMALGLDHGLLQPSKEIGDALYQWPVQIGIASDAQSFTL